MDGRKQTPTTIVLKEQDLKSYFTGSDSFLNVVTFIREQFPDPWQPVILDTTLKLPYEQLAKSLIYVRGVNDNLAKQEFLKVESPYCLVDSESKNLNLELCNEYLERKYSEFKLGYGFDYFVVLVYGDDSTRLQAIWDYLRNSETYQAIPYKFPQTFLSSFKLPSTGLDLKPYALSVAGLVDTNRATVKSLSDIIDLLKNEIFKGKTQLYDLESERSQAAKWLTLCLTNECNLISVYKDSYYFEYLSMGVGYPLSMLSMYERVTFLRNFPKTVGYLGVCNEFRCLCTLHSRIFPTPLFAFNLATQDLITDEDTLQEFDCATIHMLDYKTLFSESMSSDSSTSLSISTKSDNQQDLELSEIFYAATAKAIENSYTDVFMSIKNTLYVEHNGEHFILYFNEPLGVKLLMLSSWFGNSPQVVSEENFFRFIPTRFILAEQVLQKGDESTYTRLMTVVESDLKPPIPVRLTMYSKLCSTAIENGLSYYDKHLRQYRNILPIISHEDMSTRKYKTLFDFLQINNIKHDIVGGSSITSFGTLNQEYLSSGLIPITVDSFKGVNLLG